jgi:hypothetical protein
MGYAYRNTYWWKVFIKYAIETGSGYRDIHTTFLKNISGIQKFIKPTQRHRDCMEIA